MQVYAILPYRFNLFEVQPVVRIPVAGPAPFNTVAVVRTVVPLFSYGWASGELERLRVTMPTSLRAPSAVGGPAPVHSSSGSIRMMQITAETDFMTDDDNTDFVLSLDGVDPVSGFDENGRWHVTVDVAGSLWQVNAAATAEVTSWVLFHEDRRDDEEPIDPLVQVPGFLSSFRQFDRVVAQYVPLPLMHPGVPPQRGKRPRGPRRTDGADS
jgi:hypothetical protein